MKMTTDLDLLREYAERGSEKAFAALVARHLDLVYSAALRQVKSSQLAEDIAQSVFTDLARNVHQLKPDTVLAAWLYQVTRRTALNVSRGEARRQAREQIAVELADMNATSSDWTQIEPWLDEAMETLDEPDRAAILLRYFENKNLRDVGKTLGVGEDAAQKRVNRAVERLREFFSKRNVTVGASGLVVLISSNAVQAAPIGLIVTISSAISLAGTAIQTSTAIAAIKTIAMTTLQKTLIAVTIVVATGVGIYEARQASVLRSQIKTLQQRQAPQQQINDSDDSANKIAGMREENERLVRNTAELLKLRGEVGVLKRKLAEAEERKAQASTDAIAVVAQAESATTLSAKVEQLKQALEQMPYLKIPELQLATEKKWLLAAGCIVGDLKTDEDYRWCFHNLRSMAEDLFASMAMDALQKYMPANNGQFPTDLTQLKPYFKSPVVDAILQRYEIVPAKTIPKWNMGGDWVITSKAPVDRHDEREVIGSGGYGHGFPFYSPATN